MRKFGFNAESTTTASRRCHNRSDNCRSRDEAVMRLVHIGPGQNPDWHTITARRQLIINFFPCLSPGLQTHLLT